MHGPKREIFYDMRVHTYRVSAKENAIHRGHDNFRCEEKRSEVSISSNIMYHIMQKSKLCLIITFHSIDFHNDGLFYVDRQNIVCFSSISKNRIVRATPQKSSVLPYQNKVFRIVNRIH